MEHKDLYQYSGKGFFSRSFKTLFSGKNFKFFLLAYLIAFIPIVGAFWSLGYFYRRAQKIAWGINDEPTKADFAFGPCMKYGFAGGVIVAVFTVITIVINYIGGSIPLISYLWVFINPILYIIAIALANIYTLHFVIYNEIGAIFSLKPFKQVKDRSDSFISMNLAVFFFQVLLGVIGFFFVVIGFASVGLSTIALIGTTGVESRTSGLIYYIISNFGFLLVLSMLFGFLVLLEKVLEINASALWLLGTNVSHWTPYNDPSLVPGLNEGEYPQLEDIQTTEQNDTAQVDDSTEKEDKVLEEPKEQDSDTVEDETQVQEVVVEDISTGIVEEENAIPAKDVVIEDVSIEDISTDESSSEDK